MTIHSVKFWIKYCKRFQILDLHFLRSYVAYVFICLLTLRDQKYAALNPEERSLKSREFKFTLPYTANLYRKASFITELEKPREVIKKEVSVWNYCLHIVVKILACLEETLLAGAIKPLCIHVPLLVYIGYFGLLRWHDKLRGRISSFCSQASSATSSWRWRAKHPHSSQGNERTRGREGGRKEHSKWRTAECPFCPLNLRQFQQPRNQTIWVIRYYITEKNI